MPRKLQDWLKDPRVSSVSNETYGDSEKDGAGDGYWIYLKPGFDSMYDPHQPTTTIHEWKLKDLETAMKRVKSL